MAAETLGTREKTRRVKNHILDNYIKLADRLETNGAKDLSQNEYAKYWELTTIFAKNVLPRTQEIGGDPDNKTPIPIYGGLSRHNSDQEDIPAQEENPSS